MMALVGVGDDPKHHLRNVGEMLQGVGAYGNHADLREPTAPSWGRRVEREGEWKKVEEVGKTVAEPCEAGCHPLNPWENQLMNKSRDSTRSSVTGRHRQIQKLT